MPTTTQTSWIVWWDWLCPWTNLEVYRLCLSGMKYPVQFREPDWVAEYQMQVLEARASSLCWCICCAMYNTSNIHKKQQQASWVIPLFSLLVTSCSTNHRKQSVGCSVISGHYCGDVLCFANAFIQGDWLTWLIFLSIWYNLGRGPRISAV